MPTIEFDSFLDEHLGDQDNAARLLNACLEDEPEVFLKTVRDVIRANGGMTRVAEKTGLAREALYRAFSVNGNPSYTTISLVLAALGLRIAVEPRRDHAKIAA